MTTASAQAPFDSFFAGVLLEARLRDAMSQKAFAQVIGVSQPLVAAWERGNRPILESTLVRYANAKGVSLPELLYSAVVKAVLLEQRRKRKKKRRSPHESRAS
jgi:transcriptional regulator with XRE-family HTH domain